MNIHIITEQMRRVVLFLIFAVFLSWTGQANNVKLTKQAYVNPSTVASNSAMIEFAISWDNSWRDDYNWDAVYVFFKCKRKSEKIWNHVTLTDAGHTVTPGYDWWVNKFNTAANVAQGIFIHPDAKISGKAVVEVKVKWSLVGPNTLYTRQEFVDDQIEYVAMCVEMVYIPKGAFYLGDGIAPSSFRQTFIPIEPNWDVIDPSDLRLKIWSNDDTTNTNYWNGPPQNVANRVNESSTNTENAWNATSADRYLYIDLGKPKTICYFGVSGGNGCPSNRPTSFTLYGSTDCKTWKSLRSGNTDDWTVDKITYPVPKALKISESYRAAYRYYRLTCSGGSAYILNNIAMTEMDVESQMAQYYVVNNELPKFNTTVDLCAGDGQPWSGTVSEYYPTGYEGFYVMKYEVSQEQYVRFLNKLTGEQQKLRTVGSKLDPLQVGDYVYGVTPGSPSNRNGIILAARLDESLLFANDLNKENEMSQEGDGQSLACNFLSPNDMMAYADWAALRPLSEMEYEKICRPLYPALPKRGDWPWGSNLAADVKLPLSATITDGGKISEKVPDANVNAGNKILGPVRVGSFAKDATSQQEAGASYWGVMEVAGNLMEMCYNAQVSAGRNFQGNRREAHGDGILLPTGEANISTSYWPNIAASIALRGGCYKTTDVKQLMVSSRAYNTNHFSDLNKKEAEVTFRLGASFTYPYRLKTPTVEVCTTYLELENNQKSSSNGSAVDVICDNAPYTIKGTPLYSSGTTLKVPDGKVTYIWYKSEDNTTDWQIIPGESGQNLIYHFRNRRAAKRLVYVKRITTTPTLESETFYVKLEVINTFTRINRLRDTINQSNQVLGFFFETGSTAKHVWRWTGAASGTAPLQTNTSARVYDNYTAQRSDFGNRSGQTFTVRCEATILDKCVVNQDVEVYVEPRPAVGVPSEAIEINGTDPATACGAIMQDARDNKVYGTVKIDKQCWMAENLRYTTAGILTQFQRGDPNGDIYGVMYSWNPALYGGGCPDGWRLPSKADYDQLVIFLNKDGKNEAGLKVKAGNYWTVTDAIAQRNGMGRNTSGFGAIAAGNGNAAAGLGTNAYFLCSNADPGTSGLFFTTSSTVKTFVYGGYSSYMSVRCIRK